MGITQRWKDIKTSYKAGTSPAKSPKQDINLRRLEISGLERTVKNECFFWPSDTIWVSQTMGCRLGGVKFEFGPTAHQFAEPSRVEPSRAESSPVQSAGLGFRPGDQAEGCRPRHL